MDLEQLSIWGDEELDIISPRKKSKRELAQEAKEELNKKMISPVYLSEEENKKYGGELKKENMVSYFRQLDLNIAGRYYANPGVPQMLLTTLTKYIGKEQKELKVSDLLVFYKSVERIVSEGINGSLRKFSKANGLRFEGSQYIFMQSYLENIGAIERVD